MYILSRGALMNPGVPNDEGASIDVLIVVSHLQVFPHIVGLNSRLPNKVAESRGVVICLYV
jgi:hypothetical protein